MTQSFGLYIHIPYCLQKCPYCDFNSYGIRNPKTAELKSFPEEEYCQALIRELENAAQDSAWKNRPLHSIFFGGGTPSLFSAASYTMLFSSIHSLFPSNEALEVTMETNPGTVHEELGLEKLCQIRQSGVNRISLGVQSFSARKRKFLGRWHETEDILKAIEHIRSAQFSNYSFDFIFGVPEETFEEWESDLKQAVALEPKHISAYALTIEPGTEFGRLHKKGKLQELQEELQAEMYTFTGEFLRSSGRPRYEISNYAFPGFECRHNLGYWQGEDYLGLGAGAYSSLDRRDGSSHSLTRWVNLRGPEDYMRRCFEVGNARQQPETLSEEQAEIEFFFLKLRTQNGFSVTEFESRFEKKFSNYYSFAVEELQGLGLLLEYNDRYCLSDKGFLFSNTVFETFTSPPQRSRFAKIGAVPQSIATESKPE